MVLRLLLSLLLCFLVSCATFFEDKKERAELHMRIANAHFENGNLPLALSENLQAEKLDPSNPIIQNNLGLTYFMRQRYDLSEKSLRKALSLKSNYTDARNNLARVLIETGRYAEAEKELDVVLADLTYSGGDRAWINKGLSRFKQKDWKESMAAFQNSLQVSRDNCTANTYYGRSLFELADYQRAADALDRAVGFCQKQSFDEPHYFSALAWYRLGDRDRAEARFKEISQIYPDGKYRDKARAMLNLLRKGVE
jgi:Tfp pilus assembly protein PilF